VLASPLPDRLSGAVYQRFDGTLISTLMLTERLTFDLTGGASLSLGSAPQGGGNPQQSAAGLPRDARGEVRITYAFAQEFTVSLGARVAWLRGSSLLGSDGFGWLGFLSISTLMGSPL